MRRAVVLGAIAAVVVTFAAWPSAAAEKPKTFKLTATLTPGAEVPAVDQPGARGAFSGTYNSGTGVLTWKITFSGLSGAATAAHIHAGKRGVSGPVRVPLCGPCTSGQHGSMIIGGAGGAGSLAKGLKPSYVNVHTEANPAGEIRGQMKVTAATK